MPLNRNDMLLGPKQSLTLAKAKSEKVGEATRA